MTIIPLYTKEQHIQSMGRVKRNPGSSTTWFSPITGSGQGFSIPTVEEAYLEHILRRKLACLDRLDTKLPDLSKLLHKKTMKTDKRTRAELIAKIRDLETLVETGKACNVAYLEKLETARVEVENLKGTMREREHTINRLRHCVRETAKAAASLAQTIEHM